MTMQVQAAYVLKKKKLVSARVAVEAQGGREKRPPCASEPGPRQHDEFAWLRGEGYARLQWVAVVVIHFLTCVLHMSTSRCDIIAALVQASALQFSLLCVIPDPVCSPGYGDPVVLEG